METMERTLIILKPDAVQRRLVGEILQRFEDKGFTIAAMKMMRISESLARENYRQHEERDFYEPLVKYMSSGPVVAVLLEGKNAIQIARRMMGDTFGADAAPGTIRGDLALSNRFNLIHGSDSAEAAEREARIFFSDEEIMAYTASDMPWVYDLSGPEPV